MLIQKWHTLPPSACRNLSGNAFEGPLPAEWGLNSTWPRLTSLSLNANPALESDLPMEWATSGGFQQLKVTALPSARYWVEEPAVSALKSAVARLSETAEHAPKPGTGRVSSEVCSCKAVRDC